MKRITYKKGKYILKKSVKYKTLNTKIFTIKFLK